MSFKFYNFSEDHYSIDFYYIRTNIIRNDLVPVIYANVLID